MNRSRYIKPGLDPVYCAHMVIVMMCQQNSLRFQFFFLYVVYEFSGLVARINDVAVSLLFDADNISVALQSSPYISFYLHC